MRIGGRRGRERLTETCAEDGKGIQCAETHELVDVRLVCVRVEVRSIEI